eukprot:13407082-Alexandrium_andersonii.AAC.1
MGCWKPLALSPAKCVAGARSGCPCRRSGARERFRALQSRPRGVCDPCTAAFTSGVAAVSSSG